MVSFVECSFEVMFQRQPSKNVTGKKEVNSQTRQDKTRQCFVICDYLDGV